MNLFYKNQHSSSGILTTNLDNVNPADAVKLANIVQGNEELKTVGPFLAIGADLDWDTLLKANSDFLWSRRRC
jgi:hypothetical protein